MGFLFENNMQPGQYYHIAMYVMVLLILIFQLIVPFVMSMYKPKASGFSSDPIGGLSSGAALRFASASDGGFPGQVISYQGFTGNSEPPVLYNIGNVEETRGYETSAVIQPEGYAPSIGGIKKGFAPSIGGVKKGFTMPADPRRWQKNAFSDNDLLKKSQHNM
jgi:hypothetical protein